MATKNFSTTLLVDETPNTVFKAITNVRGWWSENIKGGTAKLNDEFTYSYSDVHSCTMRLIEVVPNKKVVWLVLDNYFKFTQEKEEWKDNKIIFEINEKNGKTEMKFTQEGLVPAYECYDICSNAWTKYLHQSLGDLITKGKGQPNPKEGQSALQEEIAPDL